MKNKTIRWIAAVVIVILLVGVALFLLETKREQSIEVESELPTIRILTIGEVESTALSRVSKALSKVTSEQIGCRVELRMIREDEYDERIDDLLLESDFADIFVCRNRTTMNKLMAGNYIYRLDRYLSRRPLLRSAVRNPQAWVNVQSEGYTYGIPFGNESAFNWGFLMRKDVCDALGIDPTEITTLEQLHELLLTVQKTYPDMIPVVNDYGETQVFADSDLLVAGAGCLISGGRVVDLCEMPEFQQRCAMMEQWYDEGLILPNAQLNQSSRGRWMTEGLAFGSFAQLDRYTARELEYVTGIPIACAVLDETYYGNNNSDMSFAVYAYTEDVDLCLRVLQLIYTNPDVLQLCIYGEENVDYTVDTDGAIIPTQECKYHNWCWPMRDIVPAPISNKNPEWFVAQTQLGFQFNNRIVSSEIYQCGEVLEKYYEALCVGAIPAANGINRMSEELKSANQPAVYVELEQQWSDWQKNN